MFFLLSGLAGPALATLGGGRNVTSEAFVPPGWDAVNFTPGWVPFALSGDHLMLSEIAARGAGTGALSDSSEYLEIANPTPHTIRLDDYYITDDLFYYRIVNGPYTFTQPLDYNFRFPPGTVLGPGEVLLVIKSELGFLTSFGGLAGWNAFVAANAPGGLGTTKIFVMDNVVFPPSVFPPMIDAAGSSLFNPFPTSIADGAGVFTNPGSTNGEWVLLYRWDGVSDLVCDVDYASWGANVANNPKVNKTGVMVDGPDPDGVASAYAADTPAGLQTNLGSGAALIKPLTYQRTDGEIGETLTAGNGCVNTAPLLTLPGPLVVNSGAVLGFTASATDAEGDVVLFALLPPAPAGATIDAQTGAVSWTAVDDGAVTFRVQADDGHGGVATGDVTVTVQNVPPATTITGPAAGSVYPVGTTVGFSGAFTDPGTADTHTAAWTFDAMSAPGTVNEAASTVTGSFTFTVPGVYAVRLTVTDDDGGSGVATTVDGVDAIVVVYDPSGGFVTGGGWFPSPAGAYTPDPLLTGKATFGFVSKYVKGSNVPVGETEFSFQAGSLNFHSTSYEWLVIGGSRAQYKGAGTVNGEGYFRFLLTAVDGALVGGGFPDKVRMKIWDGGSGAVLYDNQLGATDVAQPNTTLGGGSIVIHAGESGRPSAQESSLRPTPSEYGMELAGPSPFRTSTSIRMEIPERSLVQLAVFDVQGREVARLETRELVAGSHTRDWTGLHDRGGIAGPGLYFVRLVARSLEGNRQASRVLRVIRVGS